MYENNWSNTVLTSSVHFIKHAKYKADKIRKTIGAAT
jgi:hypothetical protein